MPSPTENSIVASPDIPGFFYDRPRKRRMPPQKDMEEVAILRQPDPGRRPA